MENMIIRDLSSLNEQEQNTWAIEVCEKYKMDKLMCPISFIPNPKTNKIIPYLNRAGSEQLIFNHKMKVTVSEPSFINNVCIVKATVIMPNGVINENIGCVNIEGLKGEALSNAIMKSTTKAKRRAVIGAVGLGLLDELEVEDIKYTEVKYTANNNKPVTHVNIVPATTKQEEEVTSAHVMLQTTTEGLNNLYKKLTAEKQNELKKFFTMKKEQILNIKN